MKLKNKYSKQYIYIYNNQKFEKSNLIKSANNMTFLNFSQLPESVFHPK